MRHVIHQESQEKKQFGIPVRHRIHERTPGTGLVAHARQRAIHGIHRSHDEQQEACPGHMAKSNQQSTTDRPGQADQGDRVGPDADAVQK